MGHGAAATDAASNKSIAERGATSRDDQRDDERWLAIDPPTAGRAGCARSVRAAPPASGSFGKDASQIDGFIETVREEGGGCGGG